MSVFNAFNVGVNGIQAQGQKIGVISDNIANVSTVGYKHADTNFKSLLNYDPSMFDGNAGVYSPSGVIGKTRTLVGAQGILNPTTSTTDLGVSGSGLFVVGATAGATASDSLRYTRAGAFSQDNNGNLKNDAGFFLKGWRLDELGNLPISLTTIPLASATAFSSLSTINVANISDTPRATTLVSISANLRSSQTPAPIGYVATVETQNMASGSIAPHFERSFDIIDDTGIAYQFTMGFLKTGINDWATEIYANNAADLGGTPTTKQIAHGNITFNGDGTLATVSPALTGPTTITWSNVAATPSSPTFNFGTAGAIFGTPGATVIGRSNGLSQFDSAYELRSLDQDGTITGTLTSINIDGEGFVSALYNNNTNRRLFKIPLAQFRDPSQLSSLTGNIYAQNTDTGTPSFIAINQSGAGRIFGNTLEQSTVELERQLTDLIIAQRAYEANTKTVTTTDNILENLTQMGAR